MNTGAGLPQTESGTDVGALRDDVQAIELNPLRRTRAVMAASFGGRQAEAPGLGACQMPLLQ